MTTHACLKILDKNNGRTVTLHTRVNGMDVPSVIPKAFDVLANHNKWMARHIAASCPDSDDLDDIMVSNCTLERLQYGPSAAAVLIAARPCFLEPVTPGAKNDLPPWSGYDAPFRLEIKGETWKLYAEGIDRFHNRANELLGEWDLHFEVKTRLMALAGT